MAKKQRPSSGRPQRSGLTPAGHEIPDPAPYRPALKMRRAASLRENIREILRSEQFARAMEDSGQETFEEADDFDVDDDFDPTSPYEEFFEGEYALQREARIEESKDITKRRRKAKEKPPPEPQPPVATPDKGTPAKPGSRPDQKGDDHS